MAKKKTAKRHMTKKKTVTRVKKPELKKKAASKKSAVNRATKKVTNKSKTKSRAKRLRPNERMEIMTVTIDEQKSGDLVVTEFGGGSIRVHHTVHPESVTTPIPGTSYKDLKKLGAGTHDISVKRTIGPADAITGATTVGT